MVSGIRRANVSQVELGGSCISTVYVIGIGLRVYIGNSAGRHDNLIESGPISDMIGCLIGSRGLTKKKTVGSFE